MLTQQEIHEVFINANLEENYNFLTEDLIKLGNAFVEKARPKLVQAEREACIDVARSVNSLVADKIAEVRAGK
jgi:hypothetical protein